MARRRVRPIQCAVAFAAFAASGCTDDATETNGIGMPGDGDEPLVSGPLCAECGPFAGGESSDFEGDLAVCYNFRAERRVSDEEATALGFDMVAIRERATREFSGPMRWIENSSTPGLPATGFTTETSVTGSVRPSGELLYQGLDPEYCDESGDCQYSDGVTEPCAYYAGLLRSTLLLELDIETADGAIEAITLPGSIRLARGPLPTVVGANFRIPLSEVSGTLQLDAKRSGPQLGSLEASVALWPDVVRGGMSPIIVPDEPRPTSFDGDGIPYEPSWQYQPISAEWPPDGCSSGTLPIDSESASARAARERLASDYPAAKAYVNMASPMAANWDDIRNPGRSGPAAQLHLELVGDPEFHCVEADGSTSFETEVHIWTDDGRLDWATTMEGNVFTRPEEPPGLSVGTTQRFDADADFWTSILRGIDLLGADSAELSLYSSFGLNDDGDAYVDGRISADLIPDRNNDFCTSLSPYGPNCDESLLFEYLYWSFFR